MLYLDEFFYLEGNMKVSSLSFCMTAGLFFLLQGFFFSCTAGAEKELANKEYGFSVYFPGDAGEIEKKTEKIETSAGNMKMDFFLAYGDRRIYMVSALRHNLPVRDEVLIWEGLMNAVSRVAGEGEIGYSQKIRFNGRPAVSAAYSKKEGDTVFYGYLIVTDIEGIQYQIQVLSDYPEGVEGKMAADFVYSFSLSG